MKKFFISVAAIIALLAPALAAQPAAALFENTKGDACAGVALNSAGDCSTPKGGLTLSVVLKDVLNILSAVVGIIAVIMVLVGGFRYIVAGGDSNAIQSARTTIVYALVGLAIAAMSQFLVQFVLNKTSSTPKPATKTGFVLPASHLALSDTAIAAALEKVPSSVL